MKLPVDYDDLTYPERRDVREEYIRIQNEKCWHCGTSLYWQPHEGIRNEPIDWALFPGGKFFLENPIHLHHSHETGMTEGAVHAFCNAYLWQYEGQ